MNSSIDSAVDKLGEFTIDLLRNLIRIPSVTGDEKAAQLYLAARLDQMGLAADVWYPSREMLQDHPAFSDDGLPLGDRPVVVATWRGRRAESRSLILNGHMDVVPTGNPSDWTGGPWSGDVREGRAWGRGACDMKGGLAAAVTAIAALQQLTIQPAGDVLIESVIGEETGGAGTLATILRGYRAGAAIILEPTAMDVCPIGAGALSFRLHVRGRAAHGALRTEGVSAVSKFYRILSAIESFESERHAGFRHPLFRPGRLAAPISIGKLEAGNWPSTVPETLIAEGRYGIFPGEDPQRARLLFEAAVAGACRDDEWLADHPAEVEWFEGQFDPGETPSSAPIIAELDGAHREVCGAPASIHGVPYGSDLRLFTNNAGMDAVLYGPGEISIAHSLNEFVPLDEVRQVAKVVARTIVRWCGM